MIRPLLTDLAVQEAVHIMQLAEAGRSQAEALTYYL
jgi:hypothetical protein